MLRFSMSWRARGGAAQFSLALEAAKEEEVWPRRSCSALLSSYSLQFLAPARGRA